MKEAFLRDSIGVFKGKSRFRCNLPHNLLIMKAFDGQFEGFYQVGAGISEHFLFFH